jgi:hypothetical protein
VSELSEGIRGGRGLSQKCGGETGREEKASATGKMDQRGCSSSSRGNNRLCRSAGGAAQVVASTSSNVEEEDDISSLLTIGAPLIMLLSLVFTS